MIYLWTALLVAALPALAQQPRDAMHDMTNMPGMNHQNMTGTAMPGTAMPGTAMPDAAMPGTAMPDEAMDASGTGRNPASAPMNMLHLSARRWTFTLHGTAFVTDIQQTGPRAADKFTSMSWGMATADRSLAGGTISFRAMLSLDPLTITGRRYPELFQTGETAFGKPIVDGQHPHNFVMELGVAYTHPLGRHASLELYAAPVGDPAMGPVAYPHRVSAEEIPQAPITHHLIDSTHVSVDVVTAALTRGIWRIEASGFHAGEPGENRWNIARGAVDSWSARLSVAPSANWTAQVSAGRLAKPEVLEPGDQIRLSASATYNRPYRGGNWATSAIWGRVHKTGDGASLNGYLLESLARFHSRNVLSARMELADKDELFAVGPVRRIGAWTGGYTRDFDLPRGLALGLGANLTTYTMPSALYPFYGRHPVMALVFLRLRVRGASS